MAPVIHLVRHAQGFHNLCQENEQIPDPDLTPFGEDQCRKLQEHFPDHAKITHLVASPLRRTLYTCLLSFEPVAKSGKKVIALPDAQEVSLQPCDTGSDPEKLKAEFKGVRGLRAGQGGVERQVRGQQIRAVTEEAGDSSSGSPPLASGLGQEGW